MKFYIHSEEHGFTMVVRCEEGYQGTVADVAMMFIKQLKQKTQAQVPENVDCQVKKGYKILDLKDEVKKKVEDKDDLFITIHQGARPKSDMKETTITDKKDTKNVDDKTDKKVNKETSFASQKGGSKPNSKIVGLMKTAVQFIEKGHFQQAARILEEITKADPGNIEAHVGLVDIYLKAERPQRALKWCRKTKEFHNNRELSLREAQCYLNMKKSDKAIDLLLTYCKDMRKSGGAAPANKHDVQVMLARAYLQKDQKDMAITVLQGVLREDGKNVDALAEFAPLIFPFAQPSQKENTMSVVLTLLANNKESSYMKEKFAVMCKCEHGLEVLKSVSGEAWNNVSSLVFMATSLRDCGAIKESLKLLDHAYNLEPGNPHTLLTYVHTMELVEKHTEAMVFMKDFVHKFPEQRVGCVTCGMVDLIVKGFTGDIYFNVAPDLSDLDLSPGDPVTNDYTEEQRYLLALLLTLVKVLYIKGALAYIPALMKLLDPCCEGHSLHETNIRNEYAYYTCISKVLRQRGDLPSLSRDTPFVYFVGDSHCVPAAWQHMSYQDNKVTIHPILSTGTKIWHLREESVFYPKVNFHSAVGVIPDNSTVLFCLGEIDCREALVYCVEQARYDGLEEAINAIIDIYVDQLSSLRKTRHWDIHVHPVMPVLDPTRSVVMQFNKQLEARLRKHKSLHWLSFVDELLTDGGLRPEYEIDGTHCHPSYISLVEKALATNDSKDVQS